MNDLEIFERYLEYFELAVARLRQRDRQRADFGHVRNQFCGYPAPAEFLHWLDSDLIPLHSGPVSVLTLTDPELKAAAEACRIAHRQAEDDAAKQANPSIRGIFEAKVIRYEALTVKFEQTRYISSREI